MDPKLLLYTRGTPFSGTEGEQWDAWIKRFEARTSQLSDTERLHVLLGLLEGKALDICAALPEKEQREYDKVREALEKRFGTKIDRLQAFSAFSHATRQPGEDVQAFGERLKRLARWTYQDQAETNEQVIQTVVNRFICGLQDTWLQRKLFTNRPKDLEAAVHAVKELHRQQEVVASLTPGPGSAAASYACPASAYAVGGDGTPWQGYSGEGFGQSPGGAQLTPGTGSGIPRRGYGAEYFDQSLNSAQLTPGAGSAAAANVRPTPTEGPAPANGPTKSGLRCFGCGDIGHIRRFCPKTWSEQRGPRNLRAAWCLCCGEDGHWMAACRHNKHLTTNSTNTTTKTPGSSQTRTSENW